MTGIEARRFWPKPIRPSQIAIEAGRKALGASGLPPDRIGCLIHASVCRDFLEPATANVVHDALGLPADAMVFDVSNACLGVMNGILLVANMIELGQIDAGLVVAGEDGLPLVESTLQQLLADPTITRKSMKSAFASLTIGSGGAAVVVARAGLAPKEHRLIGATVKSATEHHRLCQGGHQAEQVLMNTDSEALLHAGMGLAKATWAQFQAEHDFVADHYVGHQVGKAHHGALAEGLGLDPQRGTITYDRLGNVGSVSVPISLALAAEAGQLQEGQNVALLGIGSGLSSIMMGVRW